MTESPGQWSLDGTRASLDCGALSAKVDVARPQLGLHELRINEVAVPGEIGSVHWIASPPSSEEPSGESTAGWPTKVSDVYVRGRDLVASYERLPNWPFAPQIYWRIEEESALANLSMLVSIQTDSLDSHPCVRVTTRLAADEVIRLELDARHGETSIGSGNQASSSLPACVLWRLPGGRVSYAEIVPASDFRSLSRNHDESGLASAHWDLFAEFLEKGVIRRARIESLLLPRENDIELATACCQTLERRPLPLTT
jgi:hypothetical protein